MIGTGRRGQCIRFLPFRPIGFVLGIIIGHRVMPLTKSANDDAYLSKSRSPTSTVELPDCTCARQRVTNVLTSTTADIVPS